MQQDPTADRMKATVRRFYDDLWNKFDTTVADEILAPDVVFRGTLQDGNHDREGFKAYVREIEAGFPDFYQRIDAMWVDGDTCIARMHWSATHTSSFRGIAPTGRSFAYPGVAIFRFSNDLIVECWAVGDTHLMWSVITAPSA
jgi:predicted ester cyclase